MIIESVKYNKAMMSLRVAASARRYAPHRPFLRPQAHDISSGREGRGIEAIAVRWWQRFAPKATRSAIFAEIPDTTQGPGGLRRDVGDTSDLFT